MKRIFLGGYCLDQFDCYFENVYLGFLSLGKIVKILKVGMFVYDDNNIVIFEKMV